MIRNQERQEQAMEFTPNQINLLVSAAFNAGCRDDSFDIEEMIWEVHSILNLSKRLRDRIPVEDVYKWFGVKPTWDHSEQDVVKD
jgi:hypothetical protein